ncbi:PIG-L deacetylase family protein [Lichenihabitans psoromatis]|uniref:PIG-L deacetylase family protein n=1 Tax=Lichenihabitans psoromatis TaxID=2528642 RepID=UPI001036C952|nr:PIG-L deacetylase family protein [Lichenihabitans psoromatis]
MAGLGTLGSQWATRTVLVVVAHPDDEVLGCGALLAHLPAAKIIHLTDGAPRHQANAVLAGFATSADYATARRREAETALALVGIGPDQIVALGFIDQEVSLSLVEASHALSERIRHADIVLTHAYEGGHSDHDATAFAVRAAHRLGGSQAAVWEMPFYHAEADTWVRQRFFPDPAAEPEIVLMLTEEERELKRRMLAAHGSQVRTVASFSVDAERFRPARIYDFTTLPHTGPLLYERHGWNLTGPLWIERVRAALRALEPQ